MAPNWLYGHVVEHQANGQYQLRSLLLEPDTIREIYEVMKAEFPTAHVYRMESPYPNSPSSMGSRVSVDMSVFDTSSDWERQSILVVGGAVNDPSITVFLMRDNMAQIQANFSPAVLDSTTGTGITVRALALRVAQKLQAEAKPRPLWKRQFRALPWLVWLAVASAWGWVAISEKPHLSVLVLGTLAVAASAAVAWQFANRLRGRYDVWQPGNRIRSIGRAEIRQRRADNRTNAKVTAIVLPTGAVLGAVAGYLIK